jgi:phosphoribosylglycinamide formyltransferase 1
MTDSSQQLGNNPDTSELNETFIPADQPHQLKKIVVLISGSGSNLQALIDHIHQSDEPATIVAVFSNVSSAFGLQRARDARIDAHSLSHKDYAHRADFDQALSQQIDQYQPDLIVLAGFMRILTPEFVNRYQGRMLNIHPSLLPDYQGLNTHQRVLAAKDKIHGASVHFVTEELDGGPSVLQAEVPVLSGDTVDTLANRVLVQEHLIYPQVVRWFCSGRLKLQNGMVWLDKHALSSGGIRINNASD